MARNRSRNRRRRRGRFSFLFRYIAFFVTVAAMVTALALFFRMDHITVSGNRRYTEEEVVAASGLQTGRNLYLLNKFAVKEKIFAQLPYVEEVAINRKLPDTLLIELRECAAAAAVQSGTELWLISDQGKLLEQAEQAPARCPVVTGGELADPAPGRQLDMGGEAAYRAGVVLNIIRAAESRGVLENIGEIRISDDTAVVFRYLGRFEVHFPWTADVNYKLESLNAVVDYLEDNESGRIDLMTEGKASFIPE